MKKSIEPRILFVCTGNYYRSRFAEIYFNYLAEKEKLDWRSDSRGFLPNPQNIGAISPYVPEYLKKLEIIFSASKDPIKLASPDFECYSRIIALDEHEHRPLTETLFPLCCGQIEYWQVADVPLLAPETALPMIEARVRELIEELKQAA